MGALTAKLSQIGVLGLLLLAVGAQAPEAYSYRQAGGLRSLPTGSVNPTTETTTPELLSGASRIKSLPGPEWPFALAARAAVQVRPSSSDLLPDGRATGLVYAHPYAHSGRAPPSV